MVIDGSKGVRGAVQDVFGEAAQIQRCQWHTRENVVAYLPKAQQAVWRTRLQRAYWVIDVGGRLVPWFSYTITNRDTGRKTLCLTPSKSSPRRPALANGTAGFAPR